MGFITKPFNKGKKESDTKQGSGIKKPCIEKKNVWDPATGETLEDIFKNALKQSKYILPRK